MNELSIINNYIKPLVKNTKEALNLQDDTAFFKTSINSINIITTDTLVEDVHFFKEDSPSSIAHKALAVNLSDIASKGATPKFFTLNFSPKKVSVLETSWLKEFFYTIEMLQKKYKFYLIGGDITNTNSSMVISITAIGEVKKSANIPYRHKAKKQDLIGISGYIGDSYLGYLILASKYNLISKPNWLKSLTYKEIEYFINKYHYPIPKITLGKKLQPLINSCSDISDGLVKDLKNICVASNLFANITLTKNIFSKPALKVLNLEPTIINNLITGGDDYELVFTFSEKNKTKIIESFKNQINIIGTIDNKKSNNTVTIKDFNNNNITLIKDGFIHS